MLWFELLGPESLWDREEGERGEERESVSRLSWLLSVSVPHTFGAFASRHFLHVGRWSM